MKDIEFIFETFLTEAAALTKGSQRVMNDKKLVMNLADSVRDDSQAHPAAFPAGFNRTAQKAPDEQLAQWFLENIDNIEREGYEGTVYSRDGVNSDWIVRRYIAGSHNWEDLTGVMNMNLRDWYLLKNRDMLEPNHRDIPKFNSVRDIGYYITTHYKDKLEKLRDAAKNAARNKMAKSVKLVDNDDYRIYTTLNRAAGCLLGLGTQWCTANSNSGAHFHSYSGRAMLFQLFPYMKMTDPQTGNFVNVKDEDGKKELHDGKKYQFDAGGPNFMDITDHPVPASRVKENFPYIYTDLANALKSNKGKLEQAFKELSADPTLQGEDYKIKNYEIDDEIQKLHKFVERGYFTDEVRPSAKADKETHAENPEQPRQDAPQLPPGQPQMENFKDLVRQLLGEDEVEEEDELEQEANLGDMGSMGAGAGPSGGGSKYAPGTAPTMPESTTNKGTVMENVDKDVAAMLQSLKKYDMLVESVAPVLEKKKDIEEKKVEEGDMEEGNEFSGALKKAKDAHKDTFNVGGKEYHVKEAKECDVCHCAPCECDDKEKIEEKDEGKHNNATTGFKAVAKKAAAEYGSKEAGERVAGAVRNKMKAAGKIEEAQEADAEVLDWMKRFSKLGNMKGYGR